MNLKTEIARLSDLIAPLEVPLPDWNPLIGPQTMALESKADILFFGGAAGGGKGLALDTHLPTPSGWVRMGDVQVGDALLDENGRPCKVTAISEINHRQCYRLTFDDGSALVADDVHRWITFDAKELASLTRRNPAWREARRAKRPSRAKLTTSRARLDALRKRNALHVKILPVPVGTMRNTREIVDSLRTPSGRSNHAIQLHGALQLPDADLPIPPYTLGAWLGDGTSRNSQLTGIDPGIWQRIEADGFEVRHYEWSDKQHNIIGLQDKLRGAGLLQNKHIPMQYLRGSYRQRLALLHGLMDTDGHAALDGGCEYDGVNETLVRDVLHLVRSLGIKCTLQQGLAKLNGQVISDKWRVKFTTEVPVFSLPRKLARLKAETRRTAKFRYIVACDPVESVPTRCITVDSPAHLFLAGEAMIPTHNSDMLLGAAITQHLKSIIFRREYPQLKGLEDRAREIVRDRGQYNASDKVWRLSRGRMLEFGAVQNIGDESKYQGRPHDLKGFDEITHFAESQFRFLAGWLRTTMTGQRCRIICTGNPPTSAEGDWVISFWAPWLDIQHPNPAAPGELRWFTTVNGIDQEVESGDPIEINGEMVQPQSRTFIPARIEDNPYLMESGYRGTLQAMPEPLRSKMLYGDFTAGREDDPWQVIPTAWVQAAQARWSENKREGSMTTIGVDVARGGKDSTVLSPRFGKWFAEQHVHPGTTTPDGPSVVLLVINAMGWSKPAINIDVIGVGSSVFDNLKARGMNAYPMHASEKSRKRDKSGQLSFKNRRAEWWWKLREALDPDSGEELCLPPGRALLSDLCAPKWKQTPSGDIQIESKEDIIKRIGRSPDRGDSLVYAYAVEYRARTKEEMAELRWHMQR